MEQETCCPGCGGPRDVWWVYGDPEDPETAERYRQLRERAKAEHGLRECVRCAVSEAEAARTAERRREHPILYYGLHPVFEPVRDDADPQPETDMTSRA